MLSKEDALSLFKELYLKQGEHNGRWMDELNIEDSSKKYYQDITSIADKCNIKYSKGEYFNNEIKSLSEDEDVNNPLDTWTYMLVEEVETFLKNLILGKKKII